MYRYITCFESLNCVGSRTDMPHPQFYSKERIVTDDTALGKLSQTYLWPIQEVLILLVEIETRKRPAHEISRPSSPAAPHPIGRWTRTPALGDLELRIDRAFWKRQLLPGARNASGIVDFIGSRVVRSPAAGIPLGGSIYCYSRGRVPDCNCGGNLH